MWFLLIAILVVICIDAYTIYLVMKPRFGPWERMMKCSEMSQAMAETAVLYRKMGMDESANDCWHEAQRLQEEVMSIMTGQDNGSDLPSMR